MITLLVNAFDIFSELMFVLIFIKVIFSWLNVKNWFGNLISELTEPILLPIRKVLPSKTMLDFSPIVAILLLQGLQYLVHYLAKIPY